MSFIDFLNVLLGNYKPAYISAFTQYDEEGYPVEDDDLDDEDDDMYDDDDDYGYDDDSFDDDDEEDEWE